jgi:UDP-glucose 4-epimerase
MRILITGGAGCLGSNLTEHWLDRGHKVAILDNFATGDRRSLPASHPDMQVVTGSVSDAALVDGLFAEFRPTHVVHAAASYKNPDNWREDVRTNVEGTIKIVEASKRTDVRRFINFHTALCYGRPAAVPIPIDAPTRPFTSYGISKQAGEDYIGISGLPFVSFRLANVTGPRLAIGPIPTFYTRLKTGKSCFCSKAIRDFVDMEDFLALTDQALEESAPTGIYNVSTGTGHTIKEIFRIVADHLGVTLSEPVPEVPVGSDDVTAVVLDPSRTIRDFGWRPRFDFAETIRRMLAWYDRHGVTTIHTHLRAPASAASATKRNG